MFYFLLIIVLYVSDLFAESVLTRIGWEGPNATTIFILVIIFFSVILFFLLYYLNQVRLNKLAASKHSENLFKEEAERFRLSPMEIDRARDLARHEDSMEPHIIFQSITQYEKCVDKEVKILLEKGLTEELTNEENKILSNIRIKTGFHRLAQEHPLASSRNISIGQAGHVFGRGHKKPLIRHAVIVDKNEFSFTFQYDIEKEGVCYINAGEEIKFAFSRQNDGFYGISLKVISADSTGRIEVFHTVNIHRNQLRQHVRIDVGFPLKLRLIISGVNDQKRNLNRGESAEVKISDISGGGMSFLWDKPLCKGDLLSLSFNLQNRAFSGISGEVLRIDKQEGKYKTFYKHHIQFKKIKQRMRDMIVKFVFDKLRQMKQWQ